MERSRDGHDILNFPGEKRPTFGLENLVSKKFQFGNDVKFVFTLLICYISTDVTAEY